MLVAPLAIACRAKSWTRRTTTVLLRASGWRDPRIVDLDGIATAAATEMMAVWMAVTIARGQGAPPFN